MKLFLLKIYNLAGGVRLRGVRRGLVGHGKVWQVRCGWSRHGVVGSGVLWFGR